uniref:Uncharacterized protein n=1 Tax=Setaria digitata TaxID=48799 RepID=A0A915PT91_9BILA
MRSIATPMMQSSPPPPVTPAYDKELPVLPYQDQQAPIGTVPIEASAEMKANAKNPKDRQRRKKTVVVQMEEEEVVMKEEKEVEEEERVMREEEQEREAEEEDREEGEEEWEQEKGKQARTASMSVLTLLPISSKTFYWMGPTKP